MVQEHGFKVRGFKWPSPAPAAYFVHFRAFSIIFPGVSQGLLALLLMDVDSGPLLLLLVTRFIWLSACLAAQLDIASVRITPSGL